MNFGHEVALLPFAKLNQLATDNAERYRTADPFPHIVIDDFLAPEVFSALAQAFPGPEADIWYKFSSGRENLKLQSQDHHALPWAFKLLLNEVNGAEFVRFLEKLTGIDNLIPDPHLYGGGLHQTLPGGHLGMHIDYNLHNDWKLDRRLNAILYMNSDWDDAWGGDLELWDSDVTRCVRRVSPKPNRLVVFSTSENSWHGHPSPLACPANRTRRSLALYYYSNGRPESEKAESHNTVFRERPGETFKPTMKEILRDFVPPVLLRQWRRAKTDSGN